ncbi:hypothetical protein E9993_19190 [Labilibacter sediminis]|nr:hypothetical protein E9993_19190 [Labilibacter sediminis]
MILNEKRTKIVSSFSEIEISEIEYVSFFDINGQFSYALRDQISCKLFQLIKNPSFLLAFVNMKNREFIIIDVNMLETFFAPGKK